jgi:hypothetical protein
MSFLPPMLIFSFDAAFFDAARCFHSSRFSQSVFFAADASATQD